MSYKTPQNLLDFIDGYKYDSAKLLEDLTANPELGREVREVLQPIGERLGWPAEFRTWQAVLLATLGDAIGGIASPMLREVAVKRLVDSAAEIGITSIMLGMLTSDPYRLRQALLCVEIPVPGFLVP